MVKRTLRAVTATAEGVAEMDSAPRGLPLFLTHRNKGATALIATMVAATLYLGSNHFPMFPPQLLPMSKLDNWIPFVPRTVWVYLSEYPLFFSVFLLARNMVNANKYLYAFLGLQTVSVLIFLVFPTTYPRELFPLPHDLDAITAYAFGSLRSADAPTNCAPSLHVSSCYLSSFLFLREQRGKFPLFFFWASAVAITTLTTKQHYVIDVILGLLMALIFYFVFYYCIPYRDVRPLSIQAQEPAE